MNNISESVAISSTGTILAPKFYEGLPEVVGLDDDVSLHTKFYTYETEAGLVTAWSMNVMITFDRPAKHVWRCFKDFNKWQNEYGHYYSGVLGELEGKSYRIGSRSNDPGRYDYYVTKVIPENLIVVTEPVPDDGSTGGISRGFHVFMLSEHDKRTTITILMEHPCRTRNISEDEALARWREVAPEIQRKWRDSFIPSLKKLIYESK